MTRNQKSNTATANPEPKINQKSTPAPAKPEAPNEPQPKPEKCQFCDHECATKQLLFDHYKDQHCDLVFHCEQCGDYLDRNDLIAHMIGHAMSGLLGGAGDVAAASDPKTDPAEKTAPAPSNKPESRKNGDTVKAAPPKPKPKVATTQCHVCDDAVVPKQLTAHFEARHPHLDKNECPQCGSQFGCRRLLLNHIKAVHQTKRDFECSECFKTFKVESNLYQHKQSHQANSPNFQCAYCDKTFHFRANLKNHLLVHTKSFSYECGVCKKRFNNQHNLTKHMLVHKTDTFSCHMCDFICKQRRYLDDHIKRRHRRAALV
jgi:KRAB domain-containing zinc finger protein